jgi:hypothetical protein
MSDMMTFHWTVKGQFREEPRQIPVVGDFEDPNVIYTFTRGHCHSLAYALNELTGWPVVGFGAPGPDHVAVLRPDGKILDIMGVSSIAEGERMSGSYF